MLTDITTLRKAFAGDIVTPSDPTYEQALDRWATNAIRRAAVVAFVKNAEDVVLAIKYARSANLEIAIRGGGHNPMGASSTEGGLVIDLSRYLDGVRVDPKEKLAYVQGGAIWKTVDEESIKYGLAGVAGTVNHTGVGGLALGGGYGWLSGSHGLTIDNFAQVTIVTADGSILTANEKENTDLFWGVRGGGSNFGVVTEFVFKLHPQRRTIFAGVLIITPDKLDEAAAFLDSWWPTAGPNEACLMIPHGKGGEGRIMSFVVYNGTAEEGKKVFQPLIDIAVINETREAPYEELNAMTNMLGIWGSNYYFKGGLLDTKPSRQINHTTLNRLAELSSTSEHMVAIIHEYQPYQKINSVPSDATPYRRNLTGNALALVQWDRNEPEQNQRGRELAHGAAELMSNGDGYGNYNANSEERTKVLYGDNYPRLQSIKKKYDPDQVFNKWHPIVPA